MVLSGADYQCPYIRSGRILNTIGHYGLEKEDHVSRVLRGASFTLFALAVGCAATSPPVTTPSPVPAIAPVEWTARLEPTTVVAGGSAMLVVSATIRPGWHIYSPDVKGTGLP